MAGGGKECSLSQNLHGNSGRVARDLKCFVCRISIFKLLTLAKLFTLPFIYGVLLFTFSVFYHIFWLLPKTTLVFNPYLQ